jgi:hypothetical protein
MIFHPKDRRFIGEAIRATGDAAAAQKWDAWAKMFPVNQASAAAPYEIAAIALRAVTAEEANIRAQLAASPDEDAWADLANDLCYMQTIKAELIAENVGH